MKKDLLRMLDLTKEDITGILDLADQMKYDLRHGRAHRHLEGKTLGMIFEKASTRTRVSFETGMYQLGGQALFLSSSDLQIGRGEPVEDTARVLSRYLDGVMIRTFAQRTAEDLARHASIPVINGLTDLSHPCQVLADLMTVRERLSALAGVTLCYIGDGNNMCNSLTVGALTAGMSVSLAVPAGYDPAPEALTFARAFGDQFRLSRDPRAAALGADIVVTDVWASMGQESEAGARRQAFAGF
ncbi:MAG: ornithine carbamoyltransferase, partial [Oscillospiraceae bacterium]|nr:ornithine carbamoyltransferase [Oscillospiraceae bacterium]